MTRNSGSLDRTLRIIIGLGLLSLLLLLDGNSRYFGLIGLVPLVTGLVGWCPLYTVFGIRTCRLESKSR